ncbi:hypothetical protein HK101_001301, partial [Irineochytrium annulatum]
MADDRDANAKVAPTDDARIVLWSLVLSSLVDARDFASLAAVCRRSQTASKKPSVMAAHLLSSSDVFSCILDCYRSYPERLSVPVLRSLLELGVHLPRYFVLLLSREREAQRQYAKDLEAHLGYMTSMHKQVEEWERAKKERSADAKRIVAEARAKKEGDGEIDEEALLATALPPLPTFPTLVPVPPPDAIPTTNTSKLPKGVRDAIISAGTEMYGRVFPPYPPPPTTAQERLPESLQWLGRMAEGPKPPPLAYETFGASAVTTSNPAFLWPPDDAQFFAFLIRHATGAASLAKPKDSWVKVAAGIKELYYVVPKSYSSAQFLSPYRLPGVELASLSVGNSITPSASTPMTPSAGSTSSMVPPSGSAAFTAAPLAWILNEMFQHDPRLAIFLGRHGGVPEDVLQDEKAYWALISTNVHTAPNRHNPYLSASEDRIATALSLLPKPIPTQTLRRILTAHPSRFLVDRLLPHIDGGRDVLLPIATDVLTRLLGEPQSYGGVALGAADAIIGALGVPLETVATCVLVEDTAGSSAGVRTRMARAAGTIQWTHWAWCLDRFGASHAVTRACLRDLTMRGE